MTQPADDVIGEGEERHESDEIDGDVGDDADRSACACAQCFQKVAFLAENRKYVIRELKASCKIVQTFCEASLHW